MKIMASMLLVFILGCNADRNSPYPLTAKFDSVTVEKGLFSAVSTGTVRVSEGLKASRGNFKSQGPCGPSRAGSAPARWATSDHSHLVVLLNKPSSNAKEECVLSLQSSFD